MTDDALHAWHVAMRWTAPFPFPNSFFHEACVGARGGARARVAVAVAVAALLAETPDNGDAQAGGVSPPFTVCARSWFEVWGCVWARERGGGLGGERGLSDRCGVLDVALRAWALSCRGLGAEAGCGLLL